MEAPEVTINLRLNGPLLVTGPAKLIDHEGNVFNLAGKTSYALCRCGQTQRRPFCDGTHKTCGWAAEDKAV
ncbi:MAG TPA: CDGSH iron-sulfur domain-containing protein [Caulifigura sp.]|jgi:CDGSH-type Zn-finger protein|nr:CDGSH iron-sulfur domain-containing protein [Caulifigura sp.]